MASLTHGHAKENRVRDVLKARGFEYLSHDKLVDRGECVRYRPNFVLDAGTHYVVLEVDENQHMSYSCDCEQQRMINLSQAMGMPNVFVRYNPDSYKAPGGSKAARAREREDALCTWLSRMLNPESSPANKGSFSDVLYLYYDGHVSETTSVMTLIALDV
jgi:hypothetical protein